MSQRRAILITRTWVDCSHDGWSEERKTLDSDVVEQKYEGCGIHDLGVKSQRMLQILGIVTRTGLKIPKSVFLILKLSRTSVVET